MLPVGESPQPSLVFRFDLHEKGLAGRVQGDHLAENVTIKFDFLGKIRVFPLKSYFSE